MTTHVASIEHHGYAIVPNVVSHDTVSDLRDAVAAIREGDEIRRRRGTYGIRNLLEICPAARSLAISPEVRSLVASILGESCFAVRAIFFDKVAGANWGLGWHQDSVISVRERRDAPGFVGWSQKVGVWQVQPPAEILADMLAVRIHLDDCDAANGPLQVLPGSHKFGWLDEVIDDWKRRVPEVVCEAPAGGAVVMRPLLLHALAAAESPRHRRVIHIEFAHADLPGGLEWNQRIAPTNSSILSYP